jgi:hypothetical protein
VFDGGFACRIDVGELHAAPETGGAGANTANDFSMALTWHMFPCTMVAKAIPHT